MNEKAKTETRDLVGFTGVDLRGIGEVTLVQGDGFEVVVGAETKLLDLISTEIREDILVIGIQEGLESELRTVDLPITYQITLPELALLQISGAGRVVAGHFSGDSLMICVSGSGNVDVGKLEYDLVAVDIAGSSHTVIQSVDGDRLAVNISGSGTVSIEEIQAKAFASAIKGTGTIQIAGKVIKQALNIPGNGHVESEQLESQQAVINAAGMANVRVWATETLTVNINGMGKVSYHGNPHLAQTIRGIGAVTRG